MRVVFKSSKQCAARWYCLVRGWLDPTSAAVAKCGMMWTNSRGSACIRPVVMSHCTLVSRDSTSFRVEWVINNFVTIRSWCALHYGRSKRILEIITAEIFFFTAKDFKNILPLNLVKIALLNHSLGDLNLSYQAVSLFTS